MPSSSSKRLGKVRRAINWALGRRVSRADLGRRSGHVMDGTHRKLVVIERNVPSLNPPSSLRKEVTRFKKDGTTPKRTEVREYDSEGDLRARVVIGRRGLRRYAYDPKKLFRKRIRLSH